MAQGGGISNNHRLEYVVARRIEGDRRLIERNYVCSPSAPIADD